MKAAELARLPVRLQWEVFGAHVTAGELAAADAVLEQLSASGPVTPLLLRAIERLALARGQVAEALAAVRERAERFPSADHQADLAMALLRAGQVDQADRVLADAADAADLWAARSAVALAMDDTVRARAAIERALDIDSAHPAAERALVRVAWAEGRRVEAEALLADLAAELEGATTPPARLTDLAELADEIGQPAVAARLRERSDAHWHRRRAATAAQVAAALRREAAGPGRAGVGETGGVGGRAMQAALPHPSLQSQRGSGDPLSSGEPDEDSNLALDVSTQSPARRGKAGGEGSPPTPALPRSPTPSLPLTSAFPLDSLPESVMAIVRDQFGHDSLRPGQAEVIAQALSGVDTLATMPTGAGKSLCYQVAALALPGTTVVISPLIALMKDQVDSLPPGVAEVSTLINSTLDPDELRGRLDALRAGRYRLIYAAPERLRQASFLGALRAAGVGLLVVDEAHCISLWGHDFRPDYLFIPRAAAALGDPPLLAMTATATPALAADIERQMRRPLRRVRTSVFRPNLRYEVHKLKDKEAKARTLVDLCQRTTGLGIVYASSREACEQLARLLRQHRVQAAHYHAGLEREERAAVQDDFMSGRLRVIVATVAFGMGVDKRNVRFIIHFSPAKSLEAYAQESGRAGRDGGPALCALLYTTADKANLGRWARSDEVSDDALIALYGALVAHARRVGSRWLILNPATLLPRSAEPEEAVDVGVVVGMIERAGLLNRHPDAPREIVVRQRRPADENADDTALYGLLNLVDAEGRSGLATFTTERLADALDLAPADLEQRLGEWGEAGWLTFSARARDPLLELLPTPPDAERRLRQLLAETRAENGRRLKSIVDYLEARTCRHVLLAAHFGERLPACADSCDVCAARQRRGASRAPGAEEPTPTVRKAGASTAADALTTLAAAKTLPFAVGKTGLTRLLQGSISSTIKEDRSRQFGALAHLPASRVEALIERLIAAGHLHRDEEHEYRLLSITPLGRDATEADLAAVADPVPSPKPVAGRASGRAVSRSSAAGEVGAEIDMDQWDDEQHALFERLRRWRYEQASAAATPAYVIMPNEALIYLVARQPRSLADLANVKGFGPARIERYGAAVLRLIATTSTD